MKVKIIDTKLMWDTSIYDTTENEDYFDNFQNGDICELEYLEDDKSKFMLKYELDGIMYQSADFVIGEKFDYLNREVDSEGFWEEVIEED